MLVDRNFASFSLQIVQHFNLQQLLLIAAGLAPTKTI